MSTLSIPKYEYMRSLILYVWYISVDCSVQRQRWCSVNSK